MSKLLLLINTVKYLKWEQIYFRFVRKFLKPKVTETYSGHKPQSSKVWIHQTLYDDKINNQFEVLFLNYARELELPLDWNNETFSKLWLYNLHYFEDLLSQSALKKKEVHLKLLNRWVDDNPIGFGNGWEPYPSSLRIVNVIKAWLGGLKLNEKLFKSVFTQTSFLSNNLERHLLGNHYFVNLKALLFAGVIFENTRWKSIAENGLLAEIPEQILEDGANFELSPMYHSLMIIDMLDMFNLIKAYPNKISRKLSLMIEDYTPKMLSFLDAMSHPDEGTSLFNDSVNGIAPSKRKIESYAKKLGFKINHRESHDNQIIDNDHSGYICSLVAGNKLIFDASAVGPDYISGHAHADTLSFELSIGEQRVLVNSGTSEYGLSSIRHNQRKTRAHNTVEVNGKDSSQVWNSFRVANRAKIISRNIIKTGDQENIMQAAHNGYKSLFGGCIHTRKLIFKENCLIVSDTLEGEYKEAISRFYFHPDLSVTLERNTLRVEGKKFVFFSDLNGYLASIVDSFWYPEFGLKIPNKVLQLNFQGSKLDVAFTWTLN